MTARPGIRVTEGGVRVPVSLVLASTSVLVDPEPCPLCERPSRLTASDGGPCLSCGLRVAAARAIGEGVYVLATNNRGSLHADPAVS